MRSDVAHLAILAVDKSLVMRRVGPVGAKDSDCPEDDDQDSQKQEVAVNDADQGRGSQFFCRQLDFSESEFDLFVAVLGVIVIDESVAIDQPGGLDHEEPDAVEDLELDL